MKQDYKERPDFEGGQEDEDMMMDNNEVEVKSKKKKRLKKARICGSRLTKGEQEDNDAIISKSLAEINVEFGRQ